MELVRKDSSSEPRPDPAWSRDIRDFYNAVKQEPLPEAFHDLLAQIAPDIADQAEAQPHEG